VKLNATYILDFLKAAGGAKQVRPDLKDGTSASQMRPVNVNPDDCQYRYILTPMRA
jgi:hypothetical protein